MNIFSRFSLCNLCGSLLFAVTLLLSEGETAAKETFIPLLTENMFVFVHVDFHKADIDTLKGEAKKAGESLMQFLGFDDRSQRATLRDLEIVLENWDLMFRSFVETVTQDYRIQEIALIADHRLLEKRIPAVLVASWKGKTDQDRQKMIVRLLDIGYLWHEQLDGGSFQINPRQEIQEKSEGFTAILLYDCPLPTYVARRSSLFSIGFIFC